MGLIEKSVFLGDSTDGMGNFWTYHVFRGHVFVQDCRTGIIFRDAECEYLEERI